MKVVKFFMILIVCVGLATPAWAQQGGLVIGKTLKTGMPLADAIKLLGIPRTIQVARGTEKGTDSIKIEYPTHGVAVYAMNNGSTIEGIEIMPGFKGSFASGVKMGTPFNEMVGKYGAPQSYSKNIARYPDLGLYFLLNKGDQKILSAKAFVKNSKLLKQRLANPLVH